MELSYYLYESKFLEQQNHKKNQEFSGLLLKLTNENGQSGYANYHALEAFGDMVASKFLEGFRAAEPTGRHKILMQYLNQDIQNREHETDALAGAFQIENHKLLVNCLELDEGELKLIIGEGFKYFKLKMGRDLVAETSWIRSHQKLFIKNEIKLRLDFNEFFTVAEFDTWQSLNKFHEVGIIDYYEDPCSYEASYWQGWKTKGLRLAKDFNEDSDPVQAEGVQVFILKPALCNIVEWLKKLKSPKDYEYVVTHYLDSPLGVAQAVASAIKLQFFVKDRLLTCGLLPVNNVINDLNWKIQTRGPHLLFEDDLGLGFTKHLAKLEWSKFGN